MKKLLCFIIMVILSLPFSVVSAEEPLMVHLESFEVQTNGLSVFFNTNLEQPLTESQLSISLNGQELPIQDLTSVDSADCGITYLFLVDVSGSIKGKKLADIKSIMSKISEQVGDKDNAAIMLVGNDSVLQPFEYGNKNLQTQINSIQGSSEDTNLYAAMTQALGILDTSDSVQTKKCLIVLSDGDDDFKTGYTREEVNAKIEEANIPIFTIAMLSPDAPSELIETSKIFASFARLSPGGLDFTYGIDQLTIDDISKNIAQRIQQGYIAITDLSKLTLTGAQSYLEIKLKVEDRGTAADGYTLTSSLIQEQIVPSKAVTPIATIAPSQAVTPIATIVPSQPVDHEGGNTTDAKKGQKTEFLILGMIMIPIIIALFLILAFSRRRRKKKQLNKSDSVGILPIVNQQKGNQQTGNQPGKNQPGKNQPGKNPLGKNPSTGSNETNNTVLNKEEQIPKLELVFTKMGLNEGQTYKVGIDNEVIIGRDLAKAQFVFPQDNLLSSQHCKITYQNGYLYLEDMNSTNGTYVNGVPIHHQHLLENDDIIMLGSMELRINWQ